MLTGIGYTIINLGIGGISRSLAGLSIPFAGLYVLYKLSAIGAGDIKLFMGIGAFIGRDIWKIIALSFLFAAIIGAIKLIYIGINTNRRTTIHFSVAIAMGTLVYYIKGGML